MHPIISKSHSRRLTRRTFLRGAGAALGLPFLEAMLRRGAPAGEKADALPARRMVVIETSLGIMPQFFFSPQRGAATMQHDPLLGIPEGLPQGPDNLQRTIAPRRGRRTRRGTFVSLTAAAAPRWRVFQECRLARPVRRRTIGVGHAIPFIHAESGGASSVSLTRGAGSPFPASTVRRGVVQADVRAGHLLRRPMPASEELRVGRIILDFVREDAKRLQSKVGPRDRERLDQYFTSVRDLEGQFVSAGEWERRPKPKATAPQPVDITDDKFRIDQTRLLFDVVRLALESDSTRVVTILIGTSGILQIPGVKRETHSLSHHGNVPENIAELRKIEEAQFGVLAQLLSGLRVVQENGATLLDRSMLLYGASLGSANSHSNVNLPLLLAGGGFPLHGKYLEFDKQKNEPLPNLFVSMLQRLGIETDKFASSTGTLRGLEMI